MSFSQIAWEKNEHRYQAMLNMPFNQELAAGTLAPDIFRTYMIQDALYLEDFARVLAIAAAKSATASEIIQFSQAAHIAIVVERELHHEYFKKFGVTELDYQQAERSPDCELYTSYLAKLALQSSYEVLLAGLLPCFWVYLRIGQAIYQQAKPENPYMAWIETYASDDFDASVKQVIATVNHAASRASDDTIKQMHHAFKRAMQCEWLFWDSAYHQRQWGPL